MKQSHFIGMALAGLVAMVLGIFFWTKRGESKAQVETESEMEKLRKLKAIYSELRKLGYDDDEFKGKPMAELNRMKARGAKVIETVKEEENGDTTKEETTD